MGATVRRRRGLAGHVLRTARTQIEGSAVKPTRTLLRGLEVLEVLARSKVPLGPTKLSEHVGLDKATVGRLLFTLCEAGYARQESSGSYRLTGRILQLASGLSLQPELRELAHPHLVQLRDATDETVHLGMREGDLVIYIDKIDGTHPVRLMSAIGQTMPLHTTALGKAALAWMTDHELDELLPRLELTRRTQRSIATVESLRADLVRTRDRGFAIDDRENEDHAYCVGAPILGVDGQVVAMVSLSGPSYRVMEFAEENGAQCRATADAISAEVSGTVGNPAGLGTRT
jgi:DNA-binding IclR family transcriptional regulator